MSIDRCGLSGWERFAGAPVRGWAAAGVFVVVFALVGAGRAAADDTVIPSERILYRDFAGRVVDASSGKPLAGVQVTLLYETMLTNESGEFRFEKVPLTHIAELSVRIKSTAGVIIGCMTLDVPVRFYPLAAADGEKVAVEIVDPSSDEPVELKLTAIPPDGVNDFCGTCHRTNPCVETTTYRDVVKSGQDLRGIVVDEDKIEEFKKTATLQGLRKETYQKMRYQDTHPKTMNMERIPQLDLPEYKGRYTYPADLQLLDKVFVTCNTCHTRHMPTEQQYFVVESYEEDNKLCFRCHL